MTAGHEVIDCWFDSGSMPFAQWHYPFENKEILRAGATRRTSSPRPWTKPAAGSTPCWPSPPCSLTGGGLQKLHRAGPCQGQGRPEDEQAQGQRRGPLGPCWTNRGRRGALVLHRLQRPWLPSRFYEDAVGDAQRQFMGTLWNTYAFYVLYAKIDQFDPMSTPSYVS